MYNVGVYLAIWQLYLPHPISKNQLSSFLAAAECETSKKELLRNIETLRSKIKQPFTGSMAELQHQLDEHQSQLEMNERELREVSENKNGPRQDSSVCDGVDVLYCI